jgi:hypothetical protein
MLRVFGSFLALFGLLGVLVHLYGLAFLFGGSAAMLLVIDLLLTKLATGSRASRTRIGSVL